MGIRSLLRNAFGRSKAAREESNEAASGTRTPEAATIPEAREEATPEPAAPRAPAVPTARTAPSPPHPGQDPGRHPQGLGIRPRLPGVRQSEDAGEGGG
ncbi:hypothetical protein SRIMM317S_06369 [Streptomyces rimosus subsp. rimosus]